MLPLANMTPDMLQTTLQVHTNRQMAGNAIKLQQPAPQSWMIHGRPKQPVLSPRHPVCLDNRTAAALWHVLFLKQESSSSVAYAGPETEQQQHCGICCFYDRTAAAVWYLRRWHSSTSSSSPPAVDMQQLMATSLILNGPLSLYLFYVPCLLRSLLRSLSWLLLCHLLCCAELGTANQRSRRPDKADAALGTSSSNTLMAAVQSRRQQWRRSSSSVAGRAGGTRGTKPCTCQDQQGAVCSELQQVWRVW